MRTTIDLPAGLHEQVRRYADEHGQSISSTVAALTARGLTESGWVFDIQVNPLSGFPVVDLGRGFTQAEVDELLDED
ncbi:MAG: hypothetical protein LBS27_10680 [Bifidobacteriaceae bacterium]|jgi:hypothetical protein|nr:hypothetical protein [Bifidobacteriaceae bacterium]